MRHSGILRAAVYAAETASGVKSATSSELAPLYTYCRERKFPSAEVLARKQGELDGKGFPHASIAVAPEHVQVFWTVFRAVIVALEPFREDDAENISSEPGEEQPAAPAAPAKKKRK